MKPVISAGDFLRGQRDCQNGIPHTTGSESYNRGYAAQYQHEQNMTEISLMQERLRGRSWN